MYEPSGWERKAGFPKTKLPCGSKNAIINLSSFLINFRLLGISPWLGHCSESRPSGDIFLMHFMLLTKNSRTVGIVCFCLCIVFAKKFPEEMHTTINTGFLWAGRRSYFFHFYPLVLLSFSSSRVHIIFSTYLT